MLGLVRREETREKRAKDRWYQAREEPQSHLVTGVAA